MVGLSGGGFCPTSHCKNSTFSGKAKFLGSFLRGACVAALSLPSSCLQDAVGDLFQALPCFQAYLWGQGRHFWWEWGLWWASPWERHGRKEEHLPREACTSPAPVPGCPSPVSSPEVLQSTEIHPRNIPFPLPRQGEHSCRLELLP